MAALANSPATAQVGGFDPSFDAGPILNGSTNGIVRANLVAADGSHFVAGEFSSVGGVTRGNIAKLGANGSLDLSFAAGAGANGPIHAIALDSSGRLIIGGEFTTYDGVARNRIARLTTSGALDSTFDPGSGCDGPVYCIAQLGTSIYIGGDFTNYNGIARNRLAVLNTSGTLGSLSFGAGPNAAVRALLVDPSSNRLFVGGDFTAVGGLPRGYFARFSWFTGTLSGSDLAFNGPVRVITPMPTSSSQVTMFLVGGDFTSVGGVLRGRLALFNNSTSVPDSPLLDRSFNFWLDASCRSIFASSSSRVFIGGDFTTVNGRWGSRFASLASTTTTSGISSSTFWDLVAGYGDVGPDGPVNSIAVDPLGRPLLAGSFAGVPTIARNGCLRVYGDAGSQAPATPASLTAVPLSDTQIHLSWASVPLASSYTVEGSPDGSTGWSPLYTGPATTFTDASLLGGTQRFYRVLASNYNGPGGYSAVVSSTTRPSAWLGSGSLLASLPPGSVSGAVSALFRQPDGKIVVAGSFTNILGSPRRYIARLLPDLTLDPAFNPGVGANSPISQIRPAPNGGVYIFGNFSSVSSASRTNIARLTSTGALDTSFDTGTDWTFASGILTQADGRLVVFGNFQTSFDAPRDYLVRLNLDGSVDASFVGLPSGRVNSAALQSDGRLLLAGTFQSISGTPATNYTRVGTNGLRDPSFAGTNTSQNISTLVALPNGQHLASGSFTNISGTARRFISRLNENGTVDTTFDPGTSTSTASPLLFPLPNGKLIVAGSFTSVAGTTCWKMAQLGTNGVLDSSFDVEAGPGNGSISAVLPLPDGSLLVGGSFTNFGASARSHLVLLKGDGFTNAPATPLNLACTPLSSTAIVLGWTPAADVYSWKVERSPAGAGAWQQIAELSWDVAAFQDTTLFPAVSYDYRIRGWNSAGDSPYSPVATGQTMNLYQQWKLDRNLPIGASDSLDADRDGAGLFLEYALGLNPSVPERQILPVTQRLGDLFAMTYPKVRPELNYAVEASRDLIDWSSLRVNQGTGPYPTAWLPAGDEPQIFLRLRVTE